MKSTNGRGALPIGGLQNVELPPSLTVSTFTAARSNEIRAMAKAISECSATKMAFQKLPKHMRRRAMSHTVKRLPRHVREMQLNQMKKSGLPPKQKRPTRKFRRRPTNLLEEYIKRRRRVKWLFTHIWHAKRFHIIEKWGYKLPYSSCDKAFRACYRATSKHCLLQDISYYHCIEVCGNHQEIIENFKQITVFGTGLSIAAKCFYNGKRSGCTTIFQPRISDELFQKAIGDVRFLWNSENNVLWIFVHPAYYDEVLNAISQVFNSQNESMDTETADTEVMEMQTDNENQKFVKIKELQQAISFFRLTGPLSHAILQNALKLVNDSNALTNFLPEYNNNQFIKQNEYWEMLKSVSNANQLPPNMVLSLLVRDPRYNFPQKRTKSWPKYYEFDTPPNIDILPEKLSASPLWNESVREVLQNNKVSNAKIAEERSKLLVPGSVLENTGEIVPIVLIQRPGVLDGENVGYGSGWDILLPSSYAQHFWLCFIMWGARAGGLRETNSINLESFNQGILLPDTEAGKREDILNAEQSKEKYFRLPPNKRTSFHKFGITAPFFCEWNILLNNWTNSSEQITDFYVLRNKEQLRLIHDFLTSNRKELTMALPSNCLIPIKLTLPKGKCRKYSVICLPEVSDYKNPGREPIICDRLKSTRRNFRKQHKRLLERLRRRRKRARGKDKPVVPIDKEELQKYQEKMRTLWIPPVRENIRNSCNRQILGFVQNGDYSFTVGGGKAVGYVVPGVFQLLQKPPNRNKLLVRNTNSYFYRMAKFDVIL